MILTRSDQTIERKCRVMTHLNTIRHSYRAIQELCEFVGTLLTLRGGHGSFEIYGQPGRTIVRTDGTVLSCLQVMTYKTAINTVIQCRK